MSVNCPNCGERVPAKNVNIQNMTAVCPACDALFTFEPPTTKAKRRKVKQPAKLTLREDDDKLHMEFWTNFRLDRNENAFGTLFGGVAMAFVALLIVGRGAVPFLLPLGMALISLVLFYGFALMVLNKTHIDMNNETITVSRKPLPSLFSQTQDVTLSGVVAINYEETAVSKKEGYDTPRYRVWAERDDGSRRTIVNDVTEEYAVFIAQRLNAYLPLDAETDVEVSRLADDEQSIGVEADVDEVLRAFQSHSKR